MKIKSILFACALLCIVGWGPLSFLSSLFSTVSRTNSANWLESEIKTLHAQAENLNPAVLKLSLKAYVNARKQGLDDKQLLTILDYSKPSTERRLWVVDLKNNKVLFNTWVAHGKNSGEVNSNSFSNNPSSLKSSLGVFLTSETYDGHNGYSLRVQGLEEGVNDNAYRRSIVFHGADYANPQTAKQLGRLGRSWGCMAVGRQVIKPLVDTIKNQTLVFAYYPDQRWLKGSVYLRSTQV
jgi:hypothetical protein